MPNTVSAIRRVRRVAKQTTVNRLRKSKYKAAVKKMEDLAIIKGSSLTLDYKMLGYNFIAYVGILIDRSRRTYEIIEELKKKPYVTVAHITTGKYNIFCKIRAKGTEHARDIIFSIDDVEGVLRTETMISLEESINDKKRLMKNIFQDL